MRLGNYTPGFIVSYDAATRLARVRIPGVTDGSEVYPQAMFCYPIGDSSEITDIRILPGDRVWLDFVNGDPRYQIITGYRPKETDNAIDWRRFRNANIELQADTDMHLYATAGRLDLYAGADAQAVAQGAMLLQAGTTLTIRGAAVVIDGPAHFTNTVQIDGHLTHTGGRTSTGAETSNGKPIDDSHKHDGVQAGGGVSGGVH